MYSIFMFRNLICLVAQIGNMLIEMIKIENYQNQTVCLVHIIILGCYIFVNGLFYMCINKYYHHSQALSN